MVEEPVGKLFMTGLPGKNLDDSTRRLISDLRINNFILFSRNIEAPDQLADLCASIKEYCRELGATPPLIAIDQEGGTVTRLPPPFSQFPDARLLAGRTDPQAALTDYASICARELVEMGINMNFAPVLDVCPAGLGLFMERRSLGDDPLEVAALGRLVITTLQENGIAACAKHFPGLGRATLDPHKLLPVVETTAKNIYSIDLPPFQEAIDIGVASIMTSHTIYTGLDPKNLATMSSRILTDILRTKLGYQGLTITDDLEMGAIENLCPVSEAALHSFQAGADMLLICHDHAKIEKSVALFTRALHDEQISAERVRESGTRIDLVRTRFASC